MIYKMGKSPMPFLCIYSITAAIQLNGRRSHIWKEKKTGRKEKIKEALYINAMNPKDLMNLEKGFEVNQCWNEFNPEMRNIAFKKGR